jgi:hypothetical protein
MKTVAWMWHFGHNVPVGTKVSVYCGASCRYTAGVLVGHDDATGLDLVDCGNKVSGHASVNVWPLGQY